MNRFTISREAVLKFPSHLEKSTPFVMIVNNCNGMCCPDMTRCLLLRLPHVKTSRLDILEHTLLKLALDLLTLVVGPRLAVQSHEGTEVELGCLQQLDLADVDLCCVRYAFKRQYRGRKLTFCRG